MLFKQLCDMISSLSCHADTILDHILTQMEEKLEIVGNRGNKLVKAEFATIAVAHNIRKMITKGYCVCSEVAVG